jgi:hypothetical protein
MLVLIIIVIIFLHLKLNGVIIPEEFNQLTLNHSPFNVLYLIFIKNLFVVIAGLILRSLFKKIASPEMFFFSLALLALSFTSFRSLFLVDGFLGYPVYLSETISRVVYFEKIVIILCLFTSGLFSTGIPFQKQQSFLLLIMLISFILSLSIPIDLLETNIILLKGTGSEYGINKIFIILQLFAGVILMVAVLFPAPSFVAVFMSIVLYVGSLGMIMGNGTATILNLTPEISGSANATIGVTRFIISFIAGTIPALFHTGNLIPIGIVMFICTLLGNIFFMMYKKKQVLL